MIIIIFKDVPLSSEDILEMDSVNKNESMSVLVSLLRHMKDSRIYDHPDEVFTYLNWYFLLVQFKINIVAVFNF